MPDRASSRWREPLHPDDDLHGTLERTQLVERVISLEAENRVLHRVVNELAEELSGDRSMGAYVVALHARLAQQDRNIQKLTEKKPNRRKVA